MEGFISLHRKFLEWEWYDDIITKIVFLHCILLANHKTKKWKGKIIKRGCFITGRELFANQLNISVQQLRTAWKKLESTNEITIKSCPQGTEIQVVKYDLYQSTTSNLTNDQPTINQRSTTNNNDNNDNNNIEVPTLKEVWDYFDHKGYKPTIGERAWNFYDNLGWKDSKGNQIKNWKIKMQKVWFKPEYKKRDYR